MAEALTQKQETFARLVACERLSYTEAYKRAYEAENSSQETLRKRGWELSVSPRVAARISELQRGLTDAAVRKASYTLADAIGEQEDIRALAVKTGNLATAATAAANKAKLAGHMVERKEIKTGPLEEADVDELEAILESLRKKRAAETGRAQVDDGNRPEVRAS